MDIYAIVGWAIKRIFGDLDFWVLWENPAFLLMPYASKSAATALDQTIVTLKVDQTIRAGYTGCASAWDDWNSRSFGGYLSRAIMGLLRIYDKKLIRGDFQVEFMIRSPAVLFKFKSFSFSDKISAASRRLPRLGENYGKLGLPTMLIKMCMVGVRGHRGRGLHFHHVNKNVYGVFEGTCLKKQSAFPPLEGTYN
ncbi:hypothetical protein M5K25_022335 [Dendrobium thyrsiflorum]|uniref:Uncharacterized protein n=1 Tax=Dendrobium thyrsiflorum TaxID=117978 RepID=A0ABD0U647_DENTH